MKSKPDFLSSTAVCDPMYPAPPVMSIAIGVCFIIEEKSFASKNFFFFLNFVLYLENRNFSMKNIFFGGNRFLGTIIFSGLVFVFVMFLSGCSVSKKSSEITLTDLSGGVMRSDDRGQTYKPVVRLDETKTLANTETVALAMDPNNTKKLYLGSLSEGIFITEDGGETWKKSDVPISKNYAIAVHPKNSQVAYATGVYNGRGKIAKTENGGMSWKETYTEPSDGTVLLSLAVAAKNPETLYAGTSGGVVIATKDGGATWQNKYALKDPVRSLATDPSDENVVYAMTFQQSLFLSRDGGSTFSDMRILWKEQKEKEQNECEEKKKDKKQDCRKVFAQPGSVYSFALDTRSPGTGYAGTDKGLFRFTGYGKNWEEINIIGSSKSFPITAVAVGPESSKEIYYNSAQAIYRTLDGGINWFPFQIESDKIGVSVMLHDLQNPGVLYVGLRSVQK